MKYFVLVLILTLSGCVSYDRASAAFITYAAATADREAKAAWWAFCKARTTGNLFRVYQNDIPGLVLWGKICWRNNDKFNKALGEMGK